MLKINVGFNRKTGEANYGSRGASVNLELELDSGLAHEPERLKDRIRQLFSLAKASVDEELHSQPADTGQHHGKSNGQTTNGKPSRDKTRAATDSQVRALLAIADRQGIELGDKLRANFGVSTPGELTITEASQLIAELNGKTNGKGGHR